MTKKNLKLFLVVAAAAACHHGKQVESLAMPNEPAGAQAILDLTNGPLSGELLAAGDSGLVLLAGRRIVHVPFAAIRRARFSEFERGFSFGAGKPDEQRMRRVRLISHFPGGISPAVREKLLSMYHQTDWIVVP